MRNKYLAGWTSVKLDTLMLTREGCQRRQQRLLQEMERNRWDLFITGNFRTVYYLTGVLGAAEAPAAFAIYSDGTSTLVSSRPEPSVATTTVKVETYSIERAITHPAHDAALLLGKALGAKKAATCGVDRPGTPGIYEDLVPSVADATPTVLKLRKQKEEDEIDEIRASLRLCAVAYRSAKSTIAPGLTEIDVYNEMYRDVVQEAGGPVRFAGDFACGERGIKEGGPPTRSKILPGDLYILDLFPAIALYFGDTCRTFAVGTPTDRQYRAWELVKDAVRIAEVSIKPGVPAREVYLKVKEHLDSSELSEKSFWHHAGHGIGHDGHEAPRIIPGSDDIFEVGDVLTIEPGVYAQSLQGGIRLEDNYVVRENGLENLFDFPLDL